MQIVVESALEREVRLERGRESDNLLAEIERVQSRGARWDTAKDMLGYFFAMYGRMESAPAIDPAREVVQGLTVDRDERIHWQARIYKALKELAKRQGSDRGVMLLWLHFRAPSQVGEVREADGRKRVVYGQPAIAIRDLHEHDGAPDSRDATIRDFWRAFELLEDLALNRGWVRYRLERRRGNAEVRTFRRE